MPGCDVCHDGPAEVYLPGEGIWICTPCDPTFGNVPRVTQLTIETIETIEEVA